MTTIQRPFFSLWSYTSLCQYAKTDALIHILQTHKVLMYKSKSESTHFEKRLFLCHDENISHTWSLSPPSHCLSLAVYLCVCSLSPNWDHLDSSFRYVHSVTSYRWIIQYFLVQVLKSNLVFLICKGGHFSVVHQTLPMIYIQEVGFWGSVAPGLTESKFAPLRHVVFLL